ncbi:MAG: hypothetical protein EXS17_06850 [Phycisphaerales bacterium]|nr:hypothetical protein [Phycisphaerales bacterium]
MPREIRNFRPRARPLCWIALCSAALSASAHGQAIPAIEVEQPFASDHVLVRVRAGCRAAVSVTGSPTFVAPGGSPQEGLARILSTLGATAITKIPTDPPRNVEVARAIGLDRWYSIAITPGSSALAAADLLRASWDGFEVAEVDGTGGLADIPNDPSFASQYPLLNTGQSGGTIGADIRATAAWSIVSSNPTLIIATLDSGCSPHPELAGRILLGKNIPLNTTDTTDVCSGHGTHVAGILAAQGNNAAGIAGLCWDALILPVVVVNPCSGFESYVADGLTWAVDANADVINMSLQYSLGSTYLYSAVQYAAAQGVPMIAATGNSNAAVAWPAKWQETIAVAASNRFDVRWTNSNFGPEVDVTAPGESVYSLGLLSGYGTRTGTSMATPHVAGTVALMLAMYPTMSATSIRTTLMATARDIGTVGFDNYTGSGVINVAAAVAQARDTNPGLADMNGDGRVDGADLTAFLSQWGACTGCACAADFDHDCVVGGSDLALVLSTWSPQ